MLGGDNLVGDCDTDDISFLQEFLEFFSDSIYMIWNLEISK